MKPINNRLTSGTASQHSLYDTCVNDANVRGLSNKCVANSGQPILILLFI